MANRIRTSFGLAILLFTMCLAPTASAESAVELDNPIWLSESDLGLEAIAVGGESTQKVLVAGADGYARLLDGADLSNRGVRAVLEKRPSVVWKTDSWERAMATFPKHPLSRGRY